VQAFWHQPTSTPPDPTPLGHLKTALHALPLTDCHPRDFPRARLQCRYPEGHSLSLWLNAAGVLHVYLADAHTTCHYAGYAGWGDRPAVQRALQRLSSP
jgi:hypothetical protein